MKRFISFFFQGLLYVVPVAVTVYVLFLAVQIADSVFKGVPIIETIPGAGIIIILLIITLSGYLLPKLVTPTLSDAFNNLMTSTPLIKLIYTSVRDLMKAFVGEKRKFDCPVLISLDDFDINHRLGFLTQDDLSSLGIADMVAVYVPCSYSFMGDLMIVPKVKVKPIDINAADLMKLVISGGVSGKDAADVKQGEK